MTPPDHPEFKSSTDQQPMGQYYLMEKIARGGMAEIYKGIAYDLHGIKRTVVIKKILPQAAANREFIDMLIAEAKIAVMLTHGNIAQIYDLGRAGDDYFIVMEYVEGKSISQIQREVVARGEPVPVPIACYIIAEVAAGLDYMHQRTDERGQLLHIVHRDVSPQNVLISYGGTVKIIDFGIAKARTKLETTEVGILKGKFAYMSPEHARGDPIDHRNDIFSLGVILHEMLTGKRLFKAKDNRETLRNVRRAEVSSPSQINANVTKNLDEIVLKALAKRLEDRYFRAAQLHDELMRTIHREYPDFRSQQVGEFIGGLFPQEERKAGVVQESKTPFLIIDHTQSAIALERIERKPSEQGEAVPAMMAEFMLPEEKAAVQEGGAREEEEPSITFRRKSWWRHLTALLSALGSKIPWKRVGIVTLLVIMLGGLIETWQLGYWSPGRIWQALKPAPWISRIVPQYEVKPQVGTIVLDSQPVGATVFLNDQETGLRTPATLAELVANKSIRIGLFLEGYKYRSEKITPQAQQILELTIPLEVDYGTVQINTTPSGATVLINGKAMGKTPYRQAELKPGTILEVGLQLPGYRGVDRSIKIRSGKSENVRVVLERLE